MEFYQVGLTHCIDQRGELRNYYINSSKLSKTKRPKSRQELGSLYKRSRIRKIEEIGRKKIFFSEGRGSLILIIKQDCLFTQCVLEAMKTNIRHISPQNFSQTHIWPYLQYIATYKTWVQVLDKDMLSSWPIG